MIRITKPVTPPQVLTSTGTDKCATLCVEFTQFASDIQQGTRVFNFDAGVYGHPTVKQALIAAQHGKCCFCERKTGEGGDVEHFRPKAAVRQNRNTPLLRPGYYWLAYDWDNLLLACSECNQRHKKNLFPLLDPNTRARSHNDAVIAEEPLFLNPAQEDSTLHISFRKEIAFAVRGNRRGKETLAALALNRANLLEVRRDKLKILILMRQILDSHAKLSSDRQGRVLLKRAENYLTQAVTDAAEFAAMARAAAQVDFREKLP